MLKTARMRKRKATRKREDRAKAAERKVRSDNIKSGGDPKTVPTKKKMGIWGAK